MWEVKYLNCWAMKCVLYVNSLAELDEYDDIQDCTCLTAVRRAKK